MRILQVTPTFVPSKFGGIKMVSYNISKTLAKKGHEVTVYTTDADMGHLRLRNTENIKNMGGFNVWYFKNVSNWLAFKHRLFLPLGMVSAIRKDITNFDIIHFHDFRSFHNVIIHHYAKKYGIPYILQAHGSTLRTHGKRELKWLLRWLFDVAFGYRILRDASKVIALTRTEAEQYMKMGVDKDKIEIIPNGIDLSEYENLPKRGEFRKKYSIGDDEKIILYLGRIHKIKGIDLLVKAFADLIKELDDIRLVIVGPDDGFLLMLKRQIEDLKISDKILFTGPLYERDKLKAYVDADVYVLPSVYETFPNTVLEACACGTPVIVTDRCGIADVVEKVGYVVEYDKAQLRDAIFRVLSGEGLRKRFTEDGKRLVRGEFRWDKIVEKVEKLYNILIGGKTKDEND